MLNECGLVWREGECGIDGSVKFRSQVIGLPTALRPSGGGLEDQQLNQQMPSTFWLI